MSVCPKPAATDLHTAIYRLKEELAETYVAQQDGIANGLTINGAIALDEEAVASLCENLFECIGGENSNNTLIVTNTFNNEILSINV